MDKIDRIVVEDEHIWIHFTDRSDILVLDIDNESDDTWSERGGSQYKIK